MEILGKALARAKCSKIEYYANTQLKVTMSKVFISLIKSIFYFFFNFKPMIKKSLSQN